MKGVKRGLTAGIAGLLLASLLLSIDGSAAWALTDEEIFRDFRFNFVNPGARSLGMGGAFISAGDDATAAQANPAALNYVFRSEFFAEYRHVRQDTQVFTPSETIGNIDNVNNLQLPFLTLQAVNNPEDKYLPTFFSFAYPFRVAGRRARVAVSRQIVLDVQTELADGSLGTNLRFATPDFPVWGNPGSDPNRPCGSTTPAAEQYTVCDSVSGRLDAQLVHYNLAFSYALTNDFSVGVTATYATLDMESNLLSRSSDPRGMLGSVNPRGTNGPVLSDIKTTALVDDNDTGFSYTIGLHWHPDESFPNRDGISPIRFGLVYRKGADLAVQESTSLLDPNTGTPVPNNSLTTQFANTLREPDRFGLGISYHDAWKHFTFAADVERIQYSDLLEDYRTNVNFFTAVVVPSLAPAAGKPRFDVDDATVVHLGAEYSLVRDAWSFAMRAGYYNAPDNRIRMSDANTKNPQLDKVLEDVFRGGDNVDHFTAGWSMNTPGDAAIHLAADFSDIGTEYLLSAIVRFGKPR